MVDRSVQARFYYTVFETALGWVGILGSEKGLLGSTLPQHSHEYATHLLGEKLKQATPSPHRFKDTVKEFQRYCAGHRASFTDTLDLSGATPFQRLVWEITRNIPYGETRSYTWMAWQINNPRGVRAVGQALGKNFLPVIVPCHRVIAADGTLGGFNGGLEMKNRLLRLETSALRHTSTLTKYHYEESRPIGTTK